MSDKEAMLAKMDRTNGRLDAAVIAYRESPTEANRLALHTVATEHNEAFLQEQTIEFMVRCRA